MKIGHQAGHPKADQQQISEDERPGSVVDLLDLSVTFLWLRRIPEEKTRVQMQCNIKLVIN